MHFGPSIRFVRVQRGDFTHKSKPSIEHFGPMLGSYFFSYSYSVRRGGGYSDSYSKRFSMAILPVGLQVPANRLDQRSASRQFKQPSSTSTALLSTSTTKSDAMSERQSVAPLRHASFLGKEPNAADGIDIAIAYLTISETANKWVHSGELARSRKLYCGLYPTRNVVFPTWTNLAT